METGVHTKLLLGTLLGSICLHWRGLGHEIPLHQNMPSLKHSKSILQKCPAWLGLLRLFPLVTLDHQLEEELAPSAHPCISQFSLVLQRCLSTSYASVTHIH